MNFRFIIITIIIIKSDAQQIGFVTLGPLRCA